MKHAIVTGASSPIGSAFIRYCVHNNTRVTAIVRKDSQKIERIPKDPLVDLVEFSLDSPFPSLKKSDGGIFYHFAWEGTDKLQRLDPLVQEQNIKSTLKLMAWAKKIGCSSFIGAGSQAEYGRLDGLITIQSHCCPDIAYGLAKYSAGKLGQIYALQLGLRFIWARIFSVYSELDPEYSLIGMLAHRNIAKEAVELTPCGQIWDFLHVDDAAEAFYLIGLRGLDQKIYNIASGISKPLKLFIEDIRGFFSSPDLIKIGALPYPEQQVMNLRPDISELIKDTGFQPKKTFKQGFEQVLIAIKAQNQL